MDAPYEWEFVLMQWHFYFFCERGIHDWADWGEDHADGSHREYWICDWCGRPR